MTGKEDEPGWAGVLEVVEVELGSASENWRQVEVLRRPVVHSACDLPTVRL
jgi:hypothetical protein